MSIRNQLIILQNTISSSTIKYYANTSLVSDIRILYLVNIFVENKYCRHIYFGC